MNNLLRVEGLDKSFFEGGEEISVLRGLDMELGEAERLAIVGESGVGKSTLLHILGTLDRPTRGRVTYGERDLSGVEEEALADFRNREIGFIFQFHYLLPDFTALENVRNAVTVVNAQTRIYVDVCTLCRPYDDQHLMRIRLETDAFYLILQHIQNGRYTMIVSPVHFREVVAIAEPHERAEVTALLRRYRHHPLV